MDVTAIVGRDQELGLVGRWLADLSLGPSALVVSGEPGIGKTILWERARELADCGEGVVLSCRAVEAEAGFAFAGLSELLAGVLDDVAPRLAGPRRQALEVALLLAEPDVRPPDAHVIGLGLLDVMSVLCERGPLVVALDDVQWLDESSAAVLQVALRRLRGQPVGALLTVREGPGLSMPLELERLIPGLRLTRLSLAPLGPAAVRALLQQRLGLERSGAELARIFETSGGNPFFVLELARHGARVALGSRVSVPESLGFLLGERLARLPAEARDVIFTAAAAGRPRIETLVAVHGSADVVEEALDVGVREGVVELDGERVRFAHPLLASICYQQRPADKRRAGHRALARRGRSQWPQRGTWEIQSTSQQMDIGTLSLAGAVAVRLGWVGPASLR